MAWGGFAVALILAYLVQTGLAAVVNLAWFDAFLLVALLCGLLAPVHDARIAAWITGLVYDLGSADVLGIHACTLGLTALLLTRLREVGNIGVWWVRLLAGFLAAWPGQLVYLLHLHYWAGHGAASLGGLIAHAALTGLVAAVIATALSFLPRLFQRRRRRRRWLAGA
jgi:cell shape-determining protein MreD